MKCWKLAALLAIGLSPLSLCAQSAATQPSATSGMEYRPYERGMGRYGGGRMMDYAVTPAEWEEIAAFMQDYSPQRLNAVANFPDTPQRNHLKLLLVRSYRNIQHTRTEQPDVVPFLLNRLQLEDQVFKLVTDIKAANHRGESKSNADRKQALQQKVGELVDLNIKERQMRIARLEQTIGDERKHLDADSQNREQVVKKRVEAFIGAPQSEAAPFNGHDQTTVEHNKNATTQP